MHFGKTPHLARPEKSKIFFLKSALQNCVVRKALPESGSIFPKIDQNRPKFPGISGKISPGNFSPEKFPGIFPKFSPEISRNFMNFHEIITSQKSINHQLKNIVEILKSPANDVYLVHDKFGAETLIPAVKSIVLDVNIKSKKMLVDYG